VIDSRSLTDGRRRRHRCKVCDTRFTTYEITAAEYDRLQSLAVDAKVVKAAIRALRVVEKAVMG
jgi:transcriptional regulator NrdR family protein